MRAIGGKLRQWADRLDRRSLRERVLLVVVVLVVGVFCIDALFLHPRANKRRLLNEQVAGLRVTIAELDRQAEAIKVRAAEDPDRESRAKQQQLKAELAALDERLGALTVDLVSPQEMAEVLKDLLSRQNGMRLVSLENLPPEELLPAPEKNPDGEEPADVERINLYRHPVHIVVSGTYLQALGYLREIETLPRKLFWDNLEITVGDYPETEISLTVYTLGHRRGWIGV